MLPNAIFIRNKTLVMQSYFQSVSSFYSQNVSEERILTRLGYLECAYDAMLIQPYIENDCEYLVNAVHLNKGILLPLVQSYFYDVERLKHFHAIDKIDGYKQAGFMMKWIIKLRPIFFDDSQLDAKTGITKFHLFCNEIYALRIGLSMAKIQVSKVSAEFLNKQIYQLVHRNVDEHMLMMWLEAIDK